MLDYLWDLYDRMVKKFHTNSGGSMGMEGGTTDGYMG